MRKRRGRDAAALLMKNMVLRESPIVDCTNGPVGTKCVSGEGLRRGRKGRDGNGTDKNGVVEFSSALEIYK